MKITQFKKGEIMKNKANETKQTLSKVVKNLDEFLSAMSLTAVVGFSAYQAYIHRTDSILWSVLAVAAVYAVFRAFMAWNKVLNK